MSQRVRILISGFSEGGGEALAEARSIQASVSKIYEADRQLPEKRLQFRTLAPSILQAISTINLVRFSILELRRLSEGKGGIGEVLSITINMILLLHRLSRMMEETMALQQASIAIGIMGALF